MAIYRVQGPDGGIYRIEGPDDATPEQIEAFASQQFKGQPQQAAPKSPSPLDQLPWQARALGNLGAGAVRGAGSIGSTLLYPIDKALDLIKGDRAPTLSGLVTGQQPLSRNEERRQAMTEGLQSLGFDTGSAAFGAGKLGGEIAGTAGAGPALAGGAKALGMAPSIVSALRTAGMTTGANPVGAGAKAVDMATRIGAGGTTGLLAGGMIDPEMATTGAAVGAALPPALKIAGTAGHAVGRALSGPETAPAVMQAFKGGRNAGYVAPPTQVRPILGNRLMEGLAGKISTAQNASARNQAVTNAKAATSLGLPAETQLSPDVLSTLRRTAGQDYEAVKAAGVINPGKAYDDALDAIVKPHLTAQAGFPNAKASPVLDLVESLRSKAFDAASAVEKIKELRSAADDAFRAGNSDVGRASKQAAKALEDAIETHLVASGASAELLKNFRGSRELIAKTYTVEKAMNPTTGTIDAQVLARELKKGKPLSGGLREAAQFAQAFPKATQATEKMGSLPQLSPLDWAVGGGMSMAMQNPLALAAIGARPVARAAALSSPVQRGLLGPGSMYVNPDLAALLYRGSPAIAADR